MKSIKISNQYLREFVAELLGTTTLVALGCCGNAVVNLNDVNNTSGLVVTPLAWGLSLTVAIYVCGGVSGGHVNPAVTLGLACAGRFKWRKVFHYISAQYLGAFIGAVLAYLVYREPIEEKGIDSSTEGIFATYPRSGVSVITTMLDQIIGTAFFLLIICAITDRNNMAVPKGLMPLSIGFANIGLMHISFGYNCGTPLNPARDFSPRLFTLIAGWGTQTFTYDQYRYFWVPIVACHIGGIIGCWVYSLMIENHWPDDYELEEEEMNENDNDSKQVEMNNNCHQNHSNLNRVVSIEQY